MLTEDSAASLADWNRSLWKARHVAGYIDDVALTKSDLLALGKLSEPDRSRLLFRRALAELRHDPWRYPKLCLRRLAYFVLIDPTNPKTKSAVYRAGQLGLSALAFLGWILAPAAVRQKAAPTLLVVGLVAVFHALTITSVRFHIPIEPQLAVWSAFTAARLEKPHRRDRASISAASARHVVSVRIESGMLVGA